MFDFGCDLLKHCVMDNVIEFNELFEVARSDLFLEYY